MNWSKIKNIMIIILVLINLFLIVNIGVTRYTSSALPEGASESFVSLLKKSGIEIEQRLAPRVYEKRRVVTAEAYDIDYLTEIFIGEKVKYVSEGQSVVAPGGDKKLVITGEKIEYTTLKSGVDKNGRAIMHALEKTGLGTDGAYFDANDGYVKMKIDSVLLDGVYLDIFLDDEGSIASLRGVWPKIKLGASNEKVSVISAVNSICENLPEGSKIIDIDEIYVMEYTDAGYEVKNAWRVYNQGRGYICY